MENKKDNRGRQPVPKKEKKVPITIWVKHKHSVKAKKECLAIQLQYNNN